MARASLVSVRLMMVALGLTGLLCAPARARIDEAEAAKVFAEAKAICARDRGALWGRDVCGPILLVDPTDRAVVANSADPGGILQPSGKLYVGTLPDSEILANTPVEWSGTRWTQLLWPLEADSTKRQVLLAHEMFHRIQPELKLTRPEGGNQHLDDLEGRYLLQLEWRALARALEAKSSAERRAAVADALLFRHERYRLFAAAAAEESALELNEGVPEYTGVKLGLATPEERRRFALHDLSAFVDAPTFVRSFAYATDAAYGLMLDEADPHWRDKLGTGQRLDELLASALRLPAPALAELAARASSYDDGTLRKRELARDEAKQQRLRALRAKLVEGPVLILPLDKVSYQFNPQTLQPLGDHGTVFPTARLSDAWGVLEVEDGALLDKKMTVARVSAAGLDASKHSGAGWRLTLKDGWTLRRGKRKGDWIVQPIAKAAARKSSR
jgi:hypothetical protein